ncbi:MAG: (Fe-S)-binding protein [Desulfobacteraceae bacterium]|nr:MAG: (Fe-S)-binding protein [Desulfobacteraceae bacterium]
MDANRAKPSKVYFFGTCLIDSLFPQAGVAAIRLLKREGMQVIFPAAQSCCGQPAYNAGFFNEARAVARKQIQLFSKPYPIVVPSGSCAGMMKIHYPGLFAATPDFQEAQRFSERVYEFSEFLVRVLDIRLEDRGQPMRVTWHSSCHALREMGVIEDSKALIRQLARVQLVELEREEECCGFGGTFAVKQPAISAAMVGDKIDAIARTGASAVLSGDCGCLININGAMAYRQKDIPGMHLAQFLWERTDGNRNSL